MIGAVVGRVPRARRYLPAVALAAYAAAGLFTLFVSAPLLPDDLAIFIRAARRAATGQDPYQPMGIGAAFAYPPTALPLLAPLAMLPDWVAELCWRAASVALYLWAFAVLLASARSGTTAAMQGSLPGRRATLAARGRHTGAVPTSRLPAARTPAGTALPLLAAACLYAPVLEDLRVGQTNAIVLLGLALFVTRGAPTPRWVADGGLAVAMAIKVTPALLLMAPIARREVRIVARVLAVLAGLAALSLLGFGTGSWQGYAAVLPGLATGETSGSNLAPGALLARAAVWTGGAEWPGSAVIPAVVVAGCALLALRTRRSDWPALTGAMVCGAVLASPVIWYHHLTWLVVPAAGLVAAEPGGAPQRLAIAAVALVQADRPLEVLLGLPPLAATIGAWLLLVAAALKVASLKHAPAGTRLFRGVGNRNDGRGGRASPDH